MSPVSKQPALLGMVDAVINVRFFVLVIFSFAFGVPEGS